MRVEGANAFEKENKLQRIIVKSENNIYAKTASDSRVIGIK